MEQVSPSSVCYSAVNNGEAEAFRTLQRPYSYHEEEEVSSCSTTMSVVRQSGPQWGNGQSVYTVEDESSLDSTLRPPENCDIDQLLLEFTLDDSSQHSGSSSYACDAPVECPTGGASSPSACSSSGSSPPVSPGPGPESGCLACGRPRGSHLYYGGKTCTSCRAFFRRSVLSGNYKEFSCKRSQACEIDSKSWKSCKRCRLVKCTEAGMRLDLVLLEDRPEGRVKRRRQTSTRRAQQLGVAVGVRSTHSPHEMSLDESIYVKGMFQRGYDYFMTSLMSFFSRHPDCFESIMHSLNEGVKAHYKHISTIRSYLSEKAIEYHKQLAYMSEMAAEDQNVLLYHHLPIVTEYIQCLSVDDKSALKVYATKSINFLSQRVHKDKDYHELLAIMDRCNITQEREYRVIKYCERYNSPWAALEKAESRHRELTAYMGAWTRQQGNERVDDIQAMLMGLVILFTNHGQNISNTGVLHAMRNKYLTLLYKYLGGKYHQEDALAKVKEAHKIAEMAGEARMLRQRYQLPILEPGDITEVLE